MPVPYVRRQKCNNFPEQPGITTLLHRRRMIEGLGAVAYDDHASPIPGLLTFRTTLTCRFRILSLQ